MTLSASLPIIPCSVVGEIPVGSSKKLETGQKVMVQEASRNKGGTLARLPAKIIRWLKIIPGARPVNKLIKKRISHRRFRGEFKRFAKLSKASEQDSHLQWSERLPCLDDLSSTTAFDRHYVYHTAWAARVLAETLPAKHIDISSSLYFCGITSAFVPVDFYDYRPPHLQLNGLTVNMADLKALPFPNDSVPSLSCMHVVEHMGLGRYGDPLDPEGDLRAIAELKRILSPGGQLLIVVPIGRPRVQFNAHRIYSSGQFTSYFCDLRLREFTLIPDDPHQGGLIRNATTELADAQEYACGCFVFTK